MLLNELTFEGLIGALLVILLFIDVYVKIMSAIKTYREEKNRKDKPVNTLEDIVKDHADKLKNDHEQLNEQKDINRIIMRALMALLSHEINGNSDDKLKASLEEIQIYLIEK